MQKRNEVVCCSEGGFGRGEIGRLLLGGQSITCNKILRRISTSDQRSGGQDFILESDRSPTLLPCSENSIPKMKV